MKIPAVSLLSLFTVVVILVVMQCSTGAPVAKNRVTDPVQSGAIVIFQPSSLLGGTSGVITIDGKAKKRKTGRRTVSITLQQGVYDVYGVKSFRPRATLTIDGTRELYLAERNDAGMRQSLLDLRGSDSREKLAAPVREAKAARSGAGAHNASGKASVVLVAPPSFFGGPAARLSVGGKQRMEPTGENLFNATVRPCSYAVYDLASATPIATMVIDSAELVYIVNRSSGRGTRLLGDLFFENGNRKGAQALYRGALAADSTMTDLYVKIADLALAAGNRAEAIDALFGVVAAGRGDGRTCRELGDLLTAAGRNNEAREIYEKALTLAGDDPAVLMALAKVKVKTGDLQGGAVAYEHAARLRPDSVFLYKAAGEVYLKLRDTAKTVSLYKMFLEKGGRHSAVALFVGRYEYSRMNFQDALRYLAMITGKEAQKVRTLRMLGESHFRLGDLSKACVSLRTAANKTPRTSEWPAIVEMLVEANMSLGDYKKAGYWIGAYAKAGKGKNAGVAFYRAFLKEKSSPAAARTLYEQNIVNFPDDYRNFLRCGVLLSADRSTLPRSLAMIKKAALLAETVPDAWLPISRVYRKLERYDEELQALQVFAATNPRNSEVNARIGELLLKKGETEAAIEKLETTGQSAADDPAVLKALAQGYAKTGHHGKAIEALVRAGKAAPNDTLVRIRLIELYRQTGQTGRLLEEYKGLIDIRRDNPTLLGYAKLLHENRKFEEAASTIEDIRATQPDNRDALMLLGAILRAQQKYPAAIKVYEEISFIDPTDGPALFERAETHLENGQPYWAEAFYKRTLLRNPKHALAELGLARVAKLQRNRGAYNLHVSRASALAPDDPVIQQEREAGLQQAW